MGAPRTSETRAMNPDFRRELKTTSVHSLAEVSWAQMARAMIVLLRWRGMPAAVFFLSCLS